MDVETSHVTVEVNGGAMPAFLARPQAEATDPAIIVIHEILGMTDHIEDVTRRFAEQGYVALAPDLFWHIGPLPEFTDRASFARFRQSIDDRQMIQSMDAAINYLRDQPFVDKVHVGIVGFCFGGMYALLEAEHNPSLAACVDFYGGGMDYRETSERKPTSPLAEAKEMRVPFLGLFGEDDQSIPVDQVRQLEGNLKQAGIPFEIQIYPNAGHAFFNDQHDRYREHAAEDAWKRVLDFFGRHLRRQGAASR